MRFARERRYEDINLFDAQGRAIAFIDYNTKVIYLWNGTPVGHYYHRRIYTLDGHHIGWFNRGIIFDLHGLRVGYLHAQCPVIPNYMPEKGVKNIYGGRLRRPSHYQKPQFSTAFATQDFDEFLIYGP